MRNILFFFILALSSVSFAQAKHYFSVCAYEHISNDIDSSHTFAKFIKVAEEERTDVDISWLPKSYPEKFSLKPYSEQHEGENFSFDRTVEFAKQKKVRIYCTDLQTITAELFEKAVARKKLLESGQIKYQVLDKFARARMLETPPTGACNCIHAVGDTAGNFQSFLQYGVKGAQAIEKHFQAKRLTVVEDDPDLKRLEENLFSQFGLEKISDNF